MRNRTKIGILFLLIMVSVWFVSIPIYATEIGQDEIRIAATYDEDITPGRYDKFVITCENIATRDIEKISVDVSKATKDCVVVPLKNGHYKITDLVYKGSNQEIINYASNQEAVNDLILYLAIGKESVKELRKTYGAIYEYNTLSELERELSSDYEKSEMLDQKEEAKQQSESAIKESQEEKQEYTEVFKTVEESPSVIHYTQNDKEEDQEQGKKPISIVYIVFFVIILTAIALFLKRFDTKTKK